MEANLVVQGLRKFGFIQFRGPAAPKMDKIALTNIGRSSLHDSMYPEVHLFTLTVFARRAVSTSHNFLSRQIALGKV